MLTCLCTGAFYHRDGLNSCGLPVSAQAVVCGVHNNIEFSCWQVQVNFSPYTTERASELDQRAGVRGVPHLHGQLAVEHVADDETAGLRDVL